MDTETQAGIPWLMVPYELAADIILRHRRRYTIYNDDPTTVTVQPLGYRSYRIFGHWLRADVTKLPLSAPGWLRAVVVRDWAPAAAQSLPPLGADELGRASVEGAACSCDDPRHGAERMKARGATTDHA